MSVFRIEGGHPLTGTVRTQGAKNSVLPILAATLLSPGESVIHNCPRLTDVEYTLEILRRLGCRAEREGETVTVSAAAPTEWEIPDDLMREMRSSVIFLGAILGRMGRAELSYPGGCELGPRPIDLHLAALRAVHIARQSHDDLPGPQLPGGFMDLLQPLFRGMGRDHLHRGGQHLPRVADGDDCAHLPQIHSHDNHASTSGRTK